MSENIGKTDYRSSPSFNFYSDSVHLFSDYSELVKLRVLVQEVKSFLSLHNFAI